MTINPRDYDLEELRKMARQDGPPDGPRDAPRNGASGDATDPRAGESSGPRGSGNTGPLGDLGAAADRTELYRELLPFLHDETEKPYLDALPETYAAELVVFEWLEYLTANAGYHGAVDALDYYASLDWITDDVRAALSDYLLGVAESQTGEGDLDVDEHLVSLVYVAKLTAMA